MRRRATIAGSECKSAKHSAVSRFIVGITGASGTIYGIRALQVLSSIEGIEVHLVMTAGALRTMELETVHRAEDVR